MDYLITEADSGKTVKELLHKKICLSSAFIKHLKFLENGIMLDGEHATVRRVVHTGQILSLAVEDAEVHEALTPADIPLEIVYEDADMVLPNKPPFMPTHPSHLHHGDTLADALAFRYRENPTPFVFRPINRLDRNTSGLLIIAKNRIAASRLSQSMQKGEIQKQYIAVLEGVLPQSSGHIETYLRRTAESIIVREVCSEGEGGDYALTAYRVLAESGGRTLVLASPKTGRTHQLRVHFAHLGAPIVGDDMYGTSTKEIPRHALHAIALRFPHPSSGETTKLTAPLPDDLRELIERSFGGLDSLCEIENQKDK